MSSVRETFYDVARPVGMTRIFSNPGPTEGALLVDMPDDFEVVLGLHEGAVVGRESDSVLVSAHGTTFRIPTSRVATSGDSVVVGVRPEKVTIRAAARAGEPDSGRNNLTGIVTDASFTGLSTQYLVRTPWGQELQVFSQNLSADDVVRLGEDVVVSWDPSHTFGLDGAEDLNAGVDKELLELGHIAGSDGAAASVGG